MSNTECSAESRVRSDEDVCNHVKVTYDQCFDSWLKNYFLKGGMEDKCRKELLAYRACLKQHFLSRGEKEVVRCIEEYERR